MLAFLRTTTPWYVPLSLSVVLATVIAIFGARFTVGEQALAGAFAGILAAFAAMIRFQEKRHPDEIWRPPFDIARAHKITGAATIGVGAADFGLKFVNAHYAVITGLPILVLAWITGALWNAQKLTRPKENEQWTS